MIVELLIGSATSVTIVSLFVANAIDRRHTPPLPPLPKPRLSKEAIEEKRRILERHRSGLFTASGPNGSRMAIGANNDRLIEIDKELLALADQDRE